MPPEATRPLRQRLLRPHQSLDDLRREGDDDPGAGFFAALTDDGTVIATASVLHERCPWQPERTDAWRLRGMATEPALGGRGFGTAVLTAALNHVATNGGRLVWCNARTPALPFYLRAGFVPHGEESDEPQIGPHRCMWRDVPPSGEGSQEVRDQVVDRLDADTEAHHVTRNL